MSKPLFRAGVVLAIRRPDGSLLVFERVDEPGQWQLPQGGLERDETPEQAAWRELEEETSLTADDVRLVGEFEFWTAYTWPEQFQRKNLLGQVHRWFFFEPLTDDISPTPDGHEFGAWDWWSAERLIDQVVEFRKGPYRQVLGG